VGWTDALQSTYRADHGVNYTAIIERNDKDGPSNQRRDLNRLRTAIRKRVETDMYVRYTVSF
jgi:hypothetical protein